MILAPKFIREKELGKVMLINVEEIDPNPAQPRKSFEIDQLMELAQSIAVNGVLQPLTIRRVNERYQIIAGERRFRASVLAGKSAVPCIVVNTDDSQAAVYAILENLQRQDLSFFEEAVAIERLMSELHFTQEEVAQKLGKSQSFVANKLRLLKLSKIEQQIIIENNLTERHARALIRIDNSKNRLELLQMIIRKGLNVAQTDAMLNNMLENEKNKSKKESKKVFMKDMRLFVNTIKKAVGFMHNAGIEVKTKERENGENIEYVITIPKEKAYK